jgi:hypothetical protein
MHPISLRHHHHDPFLLAGRKDRRFETRLSFDRVKDHFNSSILPTRAMRFHTIEGHVHDASQCADSRVQNSSYPLRAKAPSDCCGFQVLGDQNCHNGYKVSSMSFEECRKTNEICSFQNSCFSCVLSPPGEDPPPPPYTPRPLT